MTNTFRFRDQTYRYLDHPYNQARSNSRAIEVPIAMSYLREDLRILEVGNVLKHYYPQLKHNVVDLQEEGCINVDVMAWSPRRRYDLVISISTIEHIGFGEFGHMPHHTPQAIMVHLSNFLKPGGTLLVTVPVGYNPAIDEVLEIDDLGPAFYMCKTQDGDNEWAACDKARALKMPYRHWSSATAFIEMTRLPYKRLNLGCGNRPLRNAINHDRTRHHEYVDIAHDLNELPWPWDDEQFDYINSRAVFEHLFIDLLRSFNECWRILKPGGELYVKLPHWQSGRAWDDPTHRRPYTLRTFNYFDPDTREGQEYTFYTPCKWKIINPARLNSAKSSIICTLRKRI